MAIALATMNPVCPISVEKVRPGGNISSASGLKPAFDMIFSMVLPREFMVNFP
jgi:hypothetical protein